jgi:membrane-bound inhibitor of C-type lysozyme
MKNHIMPTEIIKIIAIIFTCITSCFIGACATSPADAKMVHYECDRGTELVVTFIEKGFTTMRGGRNSMHRYEVKKVAANITLEDGTLVTLPIQKVASGFMYSNGRYILRGKNDEAMWSVGKMAAEHCVIKH